MFDKQDSIIPFSVNNDHYSVMHPTISNDGKKIFFASNMPGGYGGLDLYYCEILGVQEKKIDGKLKKSNKLSDPINLGKSINTEGNEVFPYLTRRAKENTSVSGDMSREYGLIKREMDRRGI